MMVPDYALIGEIMFFAYGFEFAKECGAKMVISYNQKFVANMNARYSLRTKK